jgi:hypothetical protein
MIFVTKNGKQEGPYSEQEVKKKLISNRFAVNDLARLEGDSEWTPLSHLLNLSELLGTVEPTPNKKPVLVWLVSILYIIYSCLVIALFGWLRFSMSSQQWKDQQGKPLGEMLSAENLIPDFIFAALYIAVAIMLFRLKKETFYLLLITFGIEKVRLIYYVCVDGWRRTIGDPPTYELIYSAIQLAIIFYLIHLVKKRVLK